MRKQKLAVVVVLLAALLGLQVFWLRHQRVESSAVRYVPLNDGVRVRRLALANASAHSQSLALDGAPVTVLLAFRATCRYCERALPAWQSLLRLATRSHTWLRLYGVSSDPEGVARTWLADRGLSTLPVLRPEPDATNHIASSITGRTPWYFIFDSVGTLVSQGYGANVMTALASIRCQDEGAQSRDSAGQRNTLTPEGLSCVK